MIVIDNSLYVPKDSVVFKTQFDAIKLYCLAKTKCNPKSSVGATFVGYDTTAFLCRPTSDIEHFLACILEHIPAGGEIDLESGIRNAHLGFIRLPEYLKKRLLVFVGGSVYMKDILEEIGKCLNGMNVAVDVVSFAAEDRGIDEYKTESLKAFVAAADKDNNSHFAYVSCHKSSARNILLRSNILSSSEAGAVPFTEEEINRKMNKSKWKMKIKKMKKMNNKKNHHSEDLEKHSQDLEEEALSSSRPLAIFPDSRQVPESIKVSS